MVSNLIRSMVNTILVNREELPKFVPRNRYFMLETDDLLHSIIVACQKNELTKELRSDLYLLNTYLISKKGNKLQSKTYVL